MKTIFSRVLALVLCLSLLPFAAPAEDVKQGYAFDLSFEMDASAYPEEDQAMVEGFADLLNMLTLSGTAVREGDSFDLIFDMLLNGNESTRTAFKLYGTDANWQLESSLLGEEKLMLNQKALLEFAMKAYYHLEMPLQYIALLISPYAHLDGVWSIRHECLGTLFHHDGARLITRDRVDQLVSFIAENAEFDRGFYNWVSALTMDLGYSDVIFESLYTLPDWVDTFMSDEGITVTISLDKTREYWVTGDTTLYQRLGDDWQLTLPPSLEGDTVTASCTREDGVMTLTADITSADGESKLDFDLVVNGLPEAFPFTGEASATLSLTGLMFPAPIELAATLVSDGVTVTLTQLDAATQLPMLTVTGVIAPAELPVPAYIGDELDGLNVFSVNDESLSEFVRNVMEPFMTGFLPILVELPASSYNSIFELLNQYGVLDLLTAGL